MVNVSIDFEIETIDWDSGTFESEHIPLKKYNFDKCIFTTQNIEDIFVIIMKIKGDFASLNYNIIAHEVIVLYSIIFNSKTILDSDMALVNEILSQVEEYIQHPPEYTAVISIDELNEEMTEEVILVMTPNDDVTLFDYSELSAILEEIKVNKLVMSINGSHYEGGAGDGTEAVMMFLLGAISSGITWDIIKALLIAKMPDIDINNFKVIDNFRFNYLRKTVAKRICVNPKELKLVSFDKNHDGNYEVMQFTFKYRKRTIKLECNKYYIINKFEML